MSNKYFWGLVIMWTTILLIVLFITGSKENKSIVNRKVEVIERLPTNTILGRTLAGEDTSLEGMLAVASVVQNRSKQEKKSINDVCLLYFDCWNTYKKRRMMLTNYYEVKEKAEKVALLAYQNELEDKVNGATHFVTKKLYYSSKRPYWVDDMKVTKVVGNHIYMKER